jgi:NHL repeat-containing protein
MAPHGICVDRDGDIYVAEVSWSIARMFNRGQPPSGPVRNAVKLKRIKRSDRGHH